MPYTLNAKLPAHVRKYSDKIQSQWRHVFNTVYEKTESEQRAFMAGNSVLKKRFNNNKESYRDDIQHLVNIFLNNLKG